MSLDYVKNILLILSGKGGVGKSSITTQLALSLSLQGHAVGILDIDLTGPSIPRFLGIESATIRQAPGGWHPVSVHTEQTLEPSAAISDPSSTQPSEERDGTRAESLPLPAQKTAVGPLYAISLGLLLQSRSASIVWRGPKKTAMVRQFLSDVLWPELDYLLIDTPPGTSDEHISVVETLLRRISDAAAAHKQPPNLAGAVIVTTPQAVAISDVRKEINFCAKTGVRVIGVVENMSGYVCPCCGVANNLFSKGGGEVMAKELNVPFLGAVPIDGLWGLLVEEGARPVYGSEALTQAAELNDSQASDEEMEDDEHTQGEMSDNQSTQPQEHGREPGLLVDKYRSCSLCPVFSDITTQVHRLIQANAAPKLVEKGAE